MLGASEITANLYCICVAVLGRLRVLQYIFAVYYMERLISYPSRSPFGHLTAIKCLLLCLMFFDIKLFYFRRRGCCSGPVRAPAARGSEATGAAWVADPTPGPAQTKDHRYIKCVPYV